ncbi:MAG: hypothetical protein WEE66_11135 [Actinomycetota bacterium]
MKAGISREGREDLARVVGPGRRFVRGADVIEVLGVGRREAVEKLGAWARSGWLRRVRRDLYIPVPVDADAPDSWSEDPLVVADEVWSPCYFTGWTAANHWELTEQVFRTVVVKTTTRFRRSPMTLLDQDYLLRRVSPDALAWGLETVWIAERRVKVASPARAVIEILDEPRLGGGIRHVAEILAAYLREHDAGLLVEAGDQLGNRTVFKRLGYLLSEMDAAPGVVDRSLERISAGFSLLDPSAPARGPYARAWNLRINVSVGGEDAS